MNAALVALVLAGVVPTCDRRTPPAEGRTEAQPPEHGGDRLERQVRAKLFSDPQLSGSGSIVVIVHGGGVILEGWVSSVNERTLAEADAATVAGVATVDNRLLVRPSGR